MTKLQKTFGWLLLAATPLAGPAHAQIQPQSLADQQAQTQAQLNQQNTQAQINNQQLQQGLAQDQARAQSLNNTTRQVMPLPPIKPPPPPPEPKKN